jgi:prepilin-type N-terminal cleavage/methylation domain-containing protein
MKAGRLKRNHRAHGFSLIEMLLVVVIILIVSAMAIPAALNMIHTFRLHNATTEFTSIVQQARMRSVKDSNFYPVRYKDTKPITEAYVDITKNSTPDITCTTTLNCDPLASWSDEVTPQAVGTFPSAGDVVTLQNLVLAGTAASGVTFLDGYDIVNSPITFSPMGIPCVPNGWTSTNVCNTASTSAAESNTVVAYYMFFQNIVTKKWEAVTITPAGKIQKWQYSGKSWVQL